MIGPDSAAGDIGPPGNLEQARSAGAVCVYGMTAADNATARRVYDRIAEKVDQTVYRKVLR